MINSKLARAVGMALGISVATLSNAAADEAAGWYFGGLAGQSQVDINKAELDDLVLSAFADAGATVLSASSSLDDSDTTWSVFGGYRLSPYFAVELGYQNLGGAAYRSSGTIGIAGFPPIPASMDFDFESSGFTLAGIGSIPLGESFELHARLGAYLADTEVTVGGSTVGFSTSESLSANSQDFFYGLGAAFHFAGNWTIGLDYQLFKDVGDDEETGEADVDALTLAVSYRL